MKNRNDSGKLVLAGGGGHALSLLESLPESIVPYGYTALSPSSGMPLPWLGTDEDFPVEGSECFFHIAVVYSGIPRMQMRRGIIDAFSSRGASFLTLIAPSAIVTPNSRLSEGCAVLAGAIVNRASIGSHAIVNTGAIVEHDCIIGSNVFIGPGVVMGGNVKIGHDTFIGLGAKIKNNVSIGHDVTVGMGAVVTRDLLKPGIYHGNPLHFTPWPEKTESSNI